MKEEHIKCTDRRFGRRLSDTERKCSRLRAFSTQTTASMSGRRLSSLHILLSGIPRSYQVTHIGFLWACSKEEVCALRRHQETALGFLSLAVSRKRPGRERRKRNMKGCAATASLAKFDGSDNWVFISYCHEVHKRFLKT